VAVEARTTELPILNAIREALFVKMESDERVVVLGQDAGRLGGVFRVTNGLQVISCGHRSRPSLQAEAKGSPRN
jgi:pyruvate dehydrogenase E1 component beta subunit